MRYTHTECFPKFAVFLLLPLFFVFPFVPLAEAASSSAGFAPSIWMSRAQVVAGESVNIFTVLYNSSDNSLSGDVVFAVDGASIGTKNFTLGAGETQIVSAPWVAKSGNHTVSARIENAAGAGVNASLVNQTTGTISISVEPPPPPSPTAQVLNTVTSAVQTGVASTVPAIAGVAGSLYGKTEALREQAKTALQKQLAENAPADASAKPKQTAGTPGSGPAEAGVSTAGADEGTPLVSKALRYMAAAGLFVVSSKTWFYISLVVMILILIQILRMAFRERKRGRRHLPLN